MARWRKTIIAVHRDVGYLAAGLTVAYAISGVAVNHIDAWNPSYTVHHEVHELGPLEADGAEAVGAEVLDRLAVDETPRAAIRVGDQVKVFLEDRTLTIDPATGTVADEHVTPRALLYEVNYLHLNKGKGVWTWIADLYAVALLVLACTGIFIITGRKGLGGRGRWLLLAGIVIPVVYLLLI